MFIEIELTDEIKSDTEAAERLSEICPVDIYAQAGDGTLEVVEENVDECVLCELCIQAAPPGTVRVKKLYDGTELG
jgi:ferredoxin-like protein FixX